MRYPFLQRAIRRRTRGKHLSGRPVATAGSWDPGCHNTASPGNTAPARRIKFNRQRQELVTFCSIAMRHPQGHTAPCPGPGQVGKVASAGWPVASLVARLKPQERSRFSARWPPGHAIVANLPAKDHCPPKALTVPRTRAGLPRIKTGAPGQALGTCPKVGPRGHKKTQKTHFKVNDLEVTSACPLPLLSGHNPEGKPPFSQKSCPVSREVPRHANYLLAPRVLPALQCRRFSSPVSFCP
jgi:hypothetical protein